MNPENNHVAFFVILSNANVLFCSGQFQQQFQEPPSPWMGDTSETTGETLSYNQRNVMKWEKDEEMGLMSSISPVLYANMEHPELKTEYPG